MVKVEGTTITMTRGDTLRVKISIKKQDGEVYTPTSSDSITFTAKKNYATDEIVIQKDIDPLMMLLQLDPEDTKDLKMPSQYVYDIQLTTSDGTVDTFIAKATLKISEEVG